MIILILHGQERIRQNNELSVVKAGTSIIIIIIKTKHMLHQSLTEPVA